MDLKLYKEDGLTLTDNIKALYPYMPVIICSAYDKSRKEVESMSADYYVTKSFDLTELMETIDMALNTDVCANPAQ